MSSECSNINRLVERKNSRGSNRPRTRCWIFRGVRIWTERANYSRNQFRALAAPLQGFLRFAWVLLDLQRNTIIGDDRITCADKKECKHSLAFCGQREELSRLLTIVEKLLYYFIEPEVKCSVVYLVYIYFVTIGYCSR